LAIIYFNALSNAAFKGVQADQLVRASYQKIAVVIPHARRENFLQISANKNSERPVMLALNFVRSARRSSLEIRGSWTKWL